MLSLVVGGLVGLVVAGLVGIPHLVGPANVASFVSNAFTFWGLVFGTFAALVTAGVAFAILNRRERKRSRWGPDRCRRLALRGRGGKLVVDRDVEGASALARGFVDLRPSYRGHRRIIHPAAPAPPRRMGSTAWRMSCSGTTQELPGLLRPMRVDLKASSSSSREELD